MRFTEPVCEVGQPVHAIIAYRGAGKPEPVLKITHNDAPSREAAATVLPGDGTAGREWAAVVTPDRPGRWKVRVADRNNLEGEAMLTVAAPPTEANDPRPNSESLQTLARGSGGEVFAPADVDRLVASLWKTDTTTSHAKPRWEPLWLRWWIAALITLLFGAEWWTRRREGLL